MELLELVKQAVHSIDPNAQVILYGSRARGDWNEESDWDFLVLLEKEATTSIKNQIIEKLFKVELQTDEIIGVTVKNKEDWSRYEVTPLFQNIQNEGVEI